MDLDLATIRTTGRAAKPILAEVVRTLRPEDLKLLEAEKGSKSVPVKKVRERHHALARCLASGMTESEAAISTGYVLSRVSVLKSDPTFAELIRFYRAEVNEQYLGMHEKMAALGSDSVQELLDRLEDDPESFSLKDLREIAAFAADRTGHGPTSKQEVSHTVNFGERLEAARRRLLAIRAEDAVVVENN